MSIAAQLGTLNREAVMSTNAREFSEVARAITLHRGDVALAEKYVRDAGLPLVKGREILKAAVQSGQLSGTWGGELAPFAQVADAFLVSLKNYGVFDQALPFMKQIPLQTQVAITTTGATAYSIGEGQLKPISRLTLGTSGQLDPQKSVAIVTATMSLVRHAGALAANLFQVELSNAVSVETDRQFLSTISSGAASVAATGASALNIMADLENLLSQLTLTAQSQVFIAVNAEQMKYWAFALNGQYGSYPGITIKGGELLGMRIVVTDTGTASAIAFDASQIAGNAGAIELDASDQASVQMDSTPDSPPTASTLQTSFWTLNLVGMKAVRWWGAEKLGSRAVAVLTGSPDSP